MARRKPVSFDDVRALLYDPPSILTWRRLWRVLERADPVLLEAELLPYVRSHLTRWPAGLRVAPAKLARAFYDPSASEKLKAVHHLLWPLVDHLRMPQTSISIEGLVNLAANPRCESLTHMTMLLWNATGYHWKSKGIVALAQSPHLVGLRSMSMNGAYISAAAASALLSAPWFLNIRELHLKGVNFRGLNLRAEMPRLETFKCDGGATEPFLEALRGEGSLPGLRTLEIHASEAPLLLRDAVVDLRRLDLMWHYGAVDDGTVFTYKCLEGLEELHSSYLPEGPILEGLANEGCWRALKSLGITRGTLQPESMETLASATALDGLESLDLSHNRIENEGVARLLEAPFIPTLTELRLKGINLGAEGVGHLMGCERLSNLRRLDLSSNRLSIRGLMHLGSPHELSALTSLGLGATGVNDRVYDAIRANPSMAALKSLSLQPCDLSIQILFEQMSDKNRDWAQRQAAIEDLLGRFERWDLLKALKEAEVKVPSTERNKPQLVSRLVEHLFDRVALARFLSSEQVLGMLNTKVLRATLKRAGQRGYSKLMGKPLVDAVRDVLGAEGALLTSATSP